VLSFTLLSSSSHLFHRDFKYLNSTPSTRLAFVTLFRRCFSSLDDGAPLAPEAVHQLCMLLCADFPFSLVRNAARITTDVPPTTQQPTPVQPQMTFKEFAHKLFVLFYFSGLLKKH
jgi:hypothetical protein